MRALLALQGVVATAVTVAACSAPGRSASGCVPLVFVVGRRATTLRFAIGSGNCGSPT
jgi:hypothetical protein